MPLKLLSVTTSYKTQLSFLLPYARHFRAKGWRVEALANGISGSDECREAFNRTIDIDWSRNPYEARNLLRIPGLVRRIVEEGEYDIVHVHTPVAAFITRLALRNRREMPRVIYTAHGFHFYQGGSLVQNTMYRTLEKVAGRWTDYLVVMNEEDLQAAKRYRIVPPERVRFMPGIGIDRQLYADKAATSEEIARVRREIGMTPQEHLFLMIGEFIPRKRHQDIIHAFASLQRDDIHLAFAGDGPVKEQMRSLARTLGADRRVHFLGIRNDIPALLGASVALLLPSLHEGLPRSIMEAFCMGRICIGSDIRGTRDLIGKECGKLVPVGDIEGYASAMAWVLDHPEEVGKMGRKARERMRAYDLNTVIRLHEELYSEALDEGSLIDFVSENNLVERS
jgi:glycosyltransferase involved in cell wall biosynthesis